MASKTLLGNRRKSAIDLLIKEMVEFHAQYEWAAYLCYRTMSSPLAKRLAREELSHFRLLAGIYPKRWGSLRKRITAKNNSLTVPPIRTPLELFIASWVFDFAGLVQLENLQYCAWRPYRKVVRQILREEAHHKQEGIQRLRQFLRRYPSRRKEAKALVRKWASISFLAFGQAGSPMDQMAVHLKLKRKSSLAQREQYFQALQRSCARLFQETRKHWETNLHGLQ